MVWFHAPRTLFVLVLGFGWLAGTGFALPKSRPAEAAPPRGYVRLDEVARDHGLEADWLTPGRTLRLTSQWTMLEFEAGSREAAWNNIRLFLGESVQAARGALWIHPVDLRATLRPLLRPSAEPAPGELKRIVIDPGHGGSDPGAANAKLRLQEKTMTLDVARRLKRTLEERGYDVVLTRDSDRRLANSQLADLQRRVDFANRASADLFISIHFNSLPADPTVNGIETYALPPAGQRSTASARSSSSDRVTHPGNRFDHWNFVLGSLVHRNLLRELEAPDRGLKRARFAVLRPIRCPAVLVEAGFLSHPAEAAKISRASYRQEIAEALGTGVQDYHARLQAARTARE